MKKTPGKPDPEGPFPAPFRVAALPTRKALRFDVTLDAESRAALVRDLELSDLPRLRLRGEIRPVGRGDFELEATLDALAVQPCAVTLAPVETTIAETVLRRYVEGMVWPEGEEIEMPEDDSAEPLPDRIDLRDVTAEALALALPDYPRAPGAELGEAIFAEADKAPLRDADVKPFAALASLRDRLSGEGGSVPSGPTSKKDGGEDSTG